MSLADIKVKIEADAKLEAEKILEVAKEKADEVRKAAEAEVSKIESSYSDRFSAEKPEVLKRREIVANLDVKKIMLGARQDLISHAFDGAWHEMANLPAERYVDFCEKLLEKAVDTGKETLFVSAKEKNLNEEWLNKYNEKHKTSLAFDKAASFISGGFILRKDDIDTNCSFDMLIKWVREDIEADVAKRLFSE
ncbi:MAG: V-type ATP synthase subunit E family protein [Aminobacterium sp.]|uniref:V-type ATP synthase subunit E n=1 Tax=Aminobacterium sp. TaxID=1872491 RepID=UPI001BCB42B6|nr:V-type ATP synthase subunit E family protein [Aminobacterium sp.]MEA4876354.1 V-type ATP synthase subunit E family protein [Aminobacterium sp.]